MKIVGNWDEDVFDIILLNENREDEFYDAFTIVVRDDEVQKPRYRWESSCIEWFSKIRDLVLPQVLDLEEEIAIMVVFREYEKMYIVERRVIFWSDGETTYDENCIDFL